MVSGEPTEECPRLTDERAVLSRLGGATVAGRARLARPSALLFMQLPEDQAGCWRAVNTGYDVRYRGLARVGNICS